MYIIYCTLLSDRFLQSQEEIVLAFLFLFLDRSSGSNQDIMFASLFYLLINLCRHTWRLCLPLFSDCVDLRSMTFLSDRTLLAHMTCVSALLRRFGWYYHYRYFLVPITIAVLSLHEVSVGELYVSHICKIALVSFSC